MSFFLENIDTINLLYVLKKIGVWMSNDGKYMGSIGEDSLCRMWAANGTMLDAFQFRSGQIWSIDVVLKNIGPCCDVYHVALG